MRVPYLVAFTACSLWFASTGITEAQQEIETGRATNQAARGETDRGLALRASSIQGMEVRNLQGEDIGDVDELIVDAQTGKIRYVTLSVGGFLGIGERFVAVPWESLELRRVADPGLGQPDFQLVADLPRQRLETAPAVDRDDWGLFGDRDYTRRIDEFYGREPRVAEEPETTPVR